MLTHLHPDVLKFLDVDDKARITAIDKDRWIGYPLAHKLFEKLDRLYYHPITYRTEGLYVYGRSFNGKTSAVREYVKRRSPIRIEDKGELRQPIVYMQSSKNSEEKPFYRELLKAVKMEGGLQADHGKDLERQSDQLLKHLQVKMLVIDEFHNLMIGSHKQQMTMLNKLKLWSNDLHISIIGIGIETGFNAIQSDDQMSSRLKSFEFPVWTKGTDYPRLLDSFERVLPLHNPSKLSRDRIATRILDLTDGLLGEISTLLKLAAQEAIKDKSERITLGLINRLADSLEYPGPPKKPSSDVTPD